MPPIDWDTQPLGEVPDIVIARRVGVSPQRVGQVRRARGCGIALGGELRQYPRWACVDQFLGILPDTLIADAIGMAPHHVGNRRRKLGIPRAESGKIMRSAACRATWSLDDDTLALLLDLDAETIRWAREELGDEGRCLNTTRKLMHNRQRGYFRVPEK